MHGALFQLDQQILGIDLAAGTHMHGFDHRIAFGVNAGFHLHGFDGQQQVTFADFLAGLHANAGHNAGIGAPT